MLIKANRHRGYPQKGKDMKTALFNSMDAYMNAAEQNESIQAEDCISIIVADGWYRMDVTTACRSYKTAIRRFFDGLPYIPAVEGWEECIKESCDNGYFSGNDFTMGDGTRNETPSWSYGVEEVGDGLWYVFLNVRA